MVEFLKISIISGILCVFTFFANAQIKEYPDLGNPYAVKKPDTTKPSRKKIYEMVEVDKFPEFPGGKDAYFKFLAKNLKWPSDSYDDTVGRIILSFVVERDGSLSGWKVQRGVGKKFDAEAIRVLKLSPRWTPGIKNGYPVRVRYLVPINIEPGE